MFIKIDKNLVLLILFFLLLIFYCNGVKVGGWTRPEDFSNSPHFKDLAHKAVGMIDEQSNSRYTLKLIEIKNVSMQIVSGIKYNMTLDIGKTKCLKEDGSQDLSKCEFNSEEMVDKCEVTIWDRAWLNKTELLNFFCTAFLKYGDYKLLN